MTEVIEQGLTALIERTLEDICRAKNRGEDDLYQYTNKYFSAVRIAEDFLSSTALDGYWKTYMGIMNGQIKDPENIVQQIVR